MHTKKVCCASGQTGKAREATWQVTPHPALGRALIRPVVSLFSRWGKRGLFSIKKLARCCAAGEEQRQNLNSDLWDSETRILTSLRPHSHAAGTLQPPLDLFLLEECLILTSYISHQHKLMHTSLFNILLSLLLFC